MFAIQLLYNGKIITRNKIIEDGWLIIEKNKIKEIGQGRPEPDNYQKELDLKGLYLGPDLIDIHCHGGN
ncbi:MAG: N-acetylglucosamine-6-phosphate deacetylase, partial [Halarsenatibacteraceae bacterium]